MKNVDRRASAMRTVCMGTFLLFFAALPPISFAETTINFDNLAVPVPPGWIELPPTYAGLEWSPLWDVVDESFFQSVYYNTYSFPSGSNAAFNDDGVELLAVASSCPFVLNSLWVSTWAAFNSFQYYSCRTLTIEGYYGDMLVGSSTINLSADRFDFWEPGITAPINKLVFKSDGPYRYWLMDDLSIAPANQAPVADAGEDLMVEAESSEGTEVTLDGSGSTDPDSTPGTNDDIVSFDWYQGDTSLGNGEIIDCTLSLGSHAVTLVVTDSCGESDDEEVIIIVHDTTPPEVEIVVPAADAALQDGVTLTAEVCDIGGVAEAYFYLREPDGGSGVPIGYEDLAGTLDASTDKWKYAFDTTQLADGHYVILAKAVDTHGNEGWSEIVPFSIRNWAVVELLPASEKNTAGRTMPVKFSLRIAESVDPTQPFVCNEELEIRIYDADYPDTILQTSLYGDTSTDYRIDGIAQLYITNFKTKKDPAEYVVEIWRTSKNFQVGSLTFETVN
ncbi:MAG: hypothetical protein JSU70_18980 [Phycisphaerales bacterium]|nr:MAG: hypothetical protein JSU70_18980 [Phycisphaerales bacterium]